MKKRNILFILSPGVFLFYMQSLFALTGTEIAQKVYDRETPRSAHVLAKMELIEKDSTVKTRYVESWDLEYEPHLRKSIIVFQSPATVKNTRFLQVEYRDRDDDKWIYLPALKRVRRIAASEGKSSFMGTDFTYDDMSNREVDQNYHTLLKEETINGYDCYVIESKAKYPDDSLYSRAVKWVIKDIWIPLRIELYDKKGNLLKIAKAERIEKVQGYWTNIVNEMKNVQTNHTTRIELKKIAYDKKLPHGLFTTQFLKTGRP